MKWKVGISKIHGNGVFAAQDLGVGEDIGVSIPMVLDTNHSRTFLRNTFGLLINDSGTANSIIEKIGDDWHFIAKLFIPEGEEITVNYSECERKIDYESKITRKRVSVV